ncbi:MAG: CpaD family pilus assembly protein [Porphyrobacter sp.]|nr:CpaD family pilus assembly protein [Porphyrobacter sp.]
MTAFRLPALAPIIALSLGLALPGCTGGAVANRSLDSIHQPVVETSTQTLDLVAGAGGLPVPEQRRLAAWFEALDLGYGDRIALEDAGAGAEADARVRQAVEALASRHGLLVDSAAAPVTPGPLTPGFVRVVVSRSRAFVPGCPDWSGSSASTLSNGTSPGYGCAVNGNLAAMIADPRDLLEGAQGSGQTAVMTSNKAISSYREQPNTAVDGLAQTVSEEE